MKNTHWAAERRRFGPTCSRKGPSLSRSRRSCFQVASRPHQRCPHMINRSVGRSQKKGTTGGAPTTKLKDTEPKDKDGTEQTKNPSSRHLQRKAPMRTAAGKPTRKRRTKGNIHTIFDNDTTNRDRSELDLKKKVGNKTLIQI